MDLFVTGVFRFLLATLFLASIIQKSESFRISQKPSDTTVVYGVNSNLFTLEWRYSDAPTEYFVQFFRQKPNEGIEQISTSKNGNAFDPSDTNDFVAALDAKLSLKDVQINEEYTYSIFLLNSNAKQVETHAVTINVVGK